MKKKILIIGNGAKEYALAKKLAEKHEIFITPASDTLKEFAQCLDIREDSVKELLEFVVENGIDLTIPISSAALKSDIVSLFNENKFTFGTFKTLIDLGIDYYTAELFLAQPGVSAIVEAYNSLESQVVTSYGNEINVKSI